MWSIMPEYHCHRHKFVAYLYFGRGQPLLLDRLIIILNTQSPFHIQHQNEYIILDVQWPTTFPYN
uniref:Uncharacterized protein n=1 Tax=Anguilla anguilla TaxID=7936 RepID=A0A0E9UM90_ANGAN